MSPANGLSTKTIGNSIQHIIQLALRLDRDRVKKILLMLRNINEIGSAQALDASDLSKLEALEVLDVFDLAKIFARGLETEGEAGVAH